MPYMYSPSIPKTRCSPLLQIPGLGRACEMDGSFSSCRGHARTPCAHKHAQVTSTTSNCDD
eukprot:1343651-Amphidinium_carterae.1